MKEVIVRFNIEGTFGFNEEWEQSIEDYLKKFNITRSGSGTGFGVRQLEFDAEDMNVSWNALIATIEVELPKVEVEYYTEDFEDVFEGKTYKWTDEGLIINYNNVA